VLIKMGLYTQASIKASQTVLIQFAAGVVERRLGNGVVLLVAIGKRSDVISMYIFYRYIQLEDNSIAGKSRNKRRVKLETSWPTDHDFVHGTFSGNGSRGR